MRSQPTIVAVTGLALLLWLAPSGWMQTQTLTEAAWQEDLDFMVREILKWHENPFHTISREQFNHSIDALRADIPNLSSRGVSVRLNQLVTEIGDAHTYVELPSSGPLAFPKHPIEYALFSDGLHVVAAGEGLEHLVGGRVLQLGEVSLRVALARLASVGYRENESTTKLSIPRFAVFPDVLSALGIATSREQTRIVVSDATGKRAEEVLKPSAKDAVRLVAFARDVTSDEPLYLRHNRGGSYGSVENWFWLEYLDEKGALYAQVNRMQDSDEETLAEFAHRFSETLGRHSPHKVILDLRFNIGGNNVLALPLVEAIVRHRESHPQFELYAVIGRASLSATIVFLGELKKYSELILVGEPTGARPNLFGDNLFIELPHSGIRVSVASEFFQAAGPYDHREAILPDVAIALSSKDFRENRDPILSQILEGRAIPADLRDELASAMEAGGLASALQAYEKFRADSRNRYRDTFRAVRRVADQLSRDGNARQAMALYGANANTYPNRARSHISLGDACVALGDNRGAREHYLRALTILPDDETLYTGLAFALDRHVRGQLEKLQNAPR